MVITSSLLDIVELSRLATIMQIFALYKRFTFRGYYDQEKRFDKKYMEFLLK